MTLLHLDGRQTPQRKTVVCIGFFDGVHLGHVRLIETAQRIARQSGLQVCVHTFHTLPSNVLRPGDSVPEITLLDEKVTLFGLLGVDLVAVSRFDLTMARMSAADFFRRVIIDQLLAEHVVAGFHHRFGFRSEADTEILARLCAANGVNLSV
ncbi:MAG: adenylyltransferase/cytidyltransferase family protein, partial [Clostridia bacterium]|nr:adenylyltransferase/cytidyltransferase family protein [Clostridia bacterium]